MDDKLGRCWSEFGVPHRTDFSFDEAAREHKFHWLVGHALPPHEVDTLVTWLSGTHLARDAGYLEVGLTTSPELIAFCVAVAP